MNATEPITKANQINPSTGKVTSWYDLTDREKFDATGDDVEIYIERLKMEQGCPTSPVIALDDETPPVLKTETKYTIKADGVNSWDNERSNLLFDTPEDAEAALALCSGFVKDEYVLRDMGPSGVIYKNGTLKRWCVHPVTLITQETYDTHLVSIERAKKAKDKNTKSMAEYIKLMEGVKDIVSRVYEERQEIGERASVYAQIIRTWTDYLETSGGDAKTAASFLMKAFPDQLEVQKAFAWERVDVPDDLAIVYGFGIASDGEVTTADDL